MESVTSDESGDGDTNVSSALLAAVTERSTDLHKQAQNLLNARKKQV